MNQVLDRRSAGRGINQALGLLVLLVPWLLCGAALEAGPRADGSGTSLIYVGNAGATTVSVIDHDSREVIKTLDIGAKHHGSVPSHRGDRIYLTTEDTGEVIAVDTGSNEILWRVQAGATLHEIQFIDAEAEDSVLLGVVEADPPIRQIQIGVSHVGGIGVAADDPKVPGIS